MLGSPLILQVGLYRPNGNTYVGGHGLAWLYEKPCIVSSIHGLLLKPE